MTQPLSLEVKQARAIERLKLENSELRSIKTKLLRSGGAGVERSMDEFRTFLQEEFKKKPPVTFQPTVVQKQKQRAKPPVSEGHSEIAVCAVSDWHISEVVNSEDSNGINEYNSLIAANRLYDWVQTVKQILCLHQAMYPISKIVLLVLGDMINGSIHPEFLLTNDLSDPAATVLAARLLEMIIVELSTLGIPIEVHCIVGNHPRMTAKMPTKVQAHTSFDWVVYETVANVFKDVSMVEFHVHTGQMALITLGGWKYLIEHGIDVKNGHEEEFEDRIRALFDDPTYREATGLKGASFDQIVIGNLHKPKFLERTIVNGALTGQNELGMAWRLKPIRAQQLMWGVSKKHVRTWSYAVDMTHIRSNKADNPFSSYAMSFMRRRAK